MCRRSHKTFTGLLAALALALALALAGASSGCAPGFQGGRAGADPPALIEASAAVRGVDRGWVVLDVRPREACESSHAAGARCLPLEALLPNPPWALDAAVRKRLGKSLAVVGVDWSSPILVVSDRGQAGLERAASACWLMSLAESGPCHILRGGHEAWRRAGGEVAKAPETDGGGGSRTESAPLHVPPLPVTWAGAHALRHASIEPDVAMVQVADPLDHGQVPGAFQLNLEALMGQERGFDEETLTRALARQGLLAEEQMIIIGSDLRDGALAWFLLDRVIELPEVKLYPGGMARYTNLSHVPVIPPREGDSSARQNARSQLDDRRVGG